MNKPTPGAMRAAEKIFIGRTFILSGDGVPRLKEMAQIIDTETGLAELLAAMKNALVTIKIIQMPVVGAPGNVASNKQLIDIMTSSFEAAIARADGN